MLKQVQLHKKVSRRDTDREIELRLAHQTAFAKIIQAQLVTDREHAVALAVAELVDACEAYVSDAAA